MDAMTDQEFEQHARLAISMSTDFLAGKINRRTYASNLKSLARKMGSDACTCDVCRGFGRARNDRLGPNSDAGHTITGGEDDERQG
jgi:hypothetical protein